MKTYGEPVFGTVKEQWPVVETTGGKIVGENRDGIAVFRGIPYGGPVDREKRWLPPVKAKSWDGVKDCTRNGPIAIQMGESISISKNFGFYYSGGHPEKFGAAKYETQNENCLVLNVLTPGIDNAKRPVIFYIHGGGYSSGTGTTGIGTDVFSREQDIVMVSVNHRLDIMGYLYLGHLDPKYAQSANVGLLDLVLALTWVRNNISRFGGDPNNVTLCGESGGGSKICHLMAMTGAKGLFRRAIVESGSASPGIRTVQDSAKTTDILLERLGLKGDPDVIEKLKALPAQYILEKAKGVEPGQEAVFGEGLAFSPAADDIIIMKTDTLYNVPKTAKDIDLLVGSSEDEMAAFVGELALGVTEENIREKLLGGLPRLSVNVTEDNVDEILEVFRENNRKHDDPGHMLIKIISASGALTSGAFYQAMAQAEKGNARVYRYFNRLDVPHNYIEGMKICWHTFDTPLFFRIVPYEYLEDYSRKTSAMWAQFARCGDPSTKEYAWPEFDIVNRYTMVFDTEFHVEEDPNRAERKIMEKYTDAGNRTM